MKELAQALTLKISEVYPSKSIFIWISESVSKPGVLTSIKSKAEITARRPD